MTLIPLRLARRGLATSTLRPPLVHLQRAILQPPPSPPVSLTINDGGSDECWAIVCGESSQARATSGALLNTLLGHHRPRQASSTDDSPLHPPVHPFLSRAPSIAPHLLHVSFSTRQPGSSTGGFVDYSTRYGAIRDEDRVTLYESLMASLGFKTGNAARLGCVPDALEGTGLEREANLEADRLNRMNWPSEDVKRRTTQAAAKAHERIVTLAPLLGLDRPPPAEDDAGSSSLPLLHRPIISLSNGQTRRARILSALVQVPEVDSGADTSPGTLMVLSEPFTGLDASTRSSLTSLLASLHAMRVPRILLVLRRQDGIPDFVTHLVAVGRDGGVRAGRVDEVGSDAHEPSADEGGYEVLRSMSRRSSNDSIPLVALSDVSIAYSGKKVLDSVSLSLHPGSRTVLAGDNGSGKTTLLSLLLGDHPQSYSLPASSLTLFGHARDHRSNARVLLSKRIGHLSPELFNAFPRKAVTRGGLTVGEAIASGFEGVFAKRDVTEEQRQRIYGLLAHFVDVVRTPGGGVVTGEDSQSAARSLTPLDFVSLDAGSQAIVLLLRAVVASPSLLILDEPFQGMDAEQTSRARAFLDAASPSLDGERDVYATGNTREERLRDAERRREMAVVLVSHFEKEWLTSCDRLIRLRDGRVVERI